ncbi:hypothetical protein FHX37_1917 [Haloactinospora alba]|uniref:Cell division protein FtsL n=1 Tax=Haloactinospora alba TaxID=405555 RepID=A0A543NJK3_9ACTN|nr:hypothetical protein [Haloactinospora alba]TQN31992.1 hypothetical protein FHX37_1917 [Haloactinospora alba]
MRRRDDTSKGAGTGPKAPRMPFVLLILGLLGGALVSLLALRTVLIEDAFAISRLEQQNSELSNQEEKLRERVVELESAGSLASSAEELGMEQGEAPVFINLETGEVIGGKASRNDGAADAGE